MVSYIGIAVLVVFVGILLFVASRPAAFRIERRAVLPATPAVIFALINDFHQWARWSPWEKLDPNMQKTFGGPAAGAGATYAWSSPGKAGAGQMILESATAPTSLNIKIQFLKPMRATNLITFTLTPAAGGTQVLWAMEGQNNFMGKAFCLIMNMDKMVGKDFEEGLANLGREAQSAAPKG